MAHALAQVMADAELLAEMPLPSVFARGQAAYHQITTRGGDEVGKQAPTK